MSVLNTIGFVINGESSLYDYNHLANKPVSDATLSQQGEFADAAATGAVKAKADSIYSETHFYPTSAGSHYVTFATVANESYRYKNNGSVTMGVSTRNGGSGGTRVETVGNIGPGEEVYFTASQNATRLSIYTGAAASDQEAGIRQKRAENNRCKDKKHCNTRCSWNHMVCDPDNDYSLHGIQRADCKLFNLQL